MGAWLNSDATCHLRLCGIVADMRHGEVTADFEAVGGNLLSEVSLPAGCMQLMRTAQVHSLVEQCTRELCNPLLVEMACQVRLGLVSCLCNAVLTAAGAVACFSCTRSRDQKEAGTTGC